MLYDKLKQGDTFRILLSPEDGGVESFSGIQITGQLRNERGGFVENFVIVISPEQISAELPASLTEELYEGVYFYDFRLIYSNGDVGHTDTYAIKVMRSQTKNVS